MHLYIGFSTMNLLIATTILGMESIIPRRMKQELINNCCEQRIDAVVVDTGHPDFVLVRRPLDPEEVARGKPPAQP